MLRKALGPWLIGTAAALSVVIGSAAVQPPVSAQVAVDTSVATLLVTELALVELTNADRVANGLPALEFDPHTLLIARERAAKQLEIDNLSHYDEHGLLAFVGLLDGAGVRYALAGENLARSTSSSGDVLSRIEAAWMNSPTHRKNILEKSFTRIAIGAATDSDGRIAFAQIFRGE
jgi:uncharacterized protein YkwD